MKTIRVIKVTIVVVDEYYNYLYFIEGNERSKTKIYGALTIEREIDEYYFMSKRAIKMFNQA